MIANQRTWPSTGEPADSCSTEDLVAERFAQADAERSQYLERCIEADRRLQAWKRAKWAGAFRWRTLRDTPEWITTDVLGRG